MKWKSLFLLMLIFVILSFCRSGIAQTHDKQDSIYLIKLNIATPSGGVNITTAVRPRSERAFDVPASAHAHEVHVLPVCRGHAGHLVGCDRCLVAVDRGTRDGRRGESSQLLGCCHVRDDRVEARSAQQDVIAGQGLAVVGDQRARGGRVLGAQRAIEPRDRRFRRLADGC
jgi:hypothetical protein